MVAQADSSTDPLLNRAPAGDRAAVYEPFARHLRAKHGDFPEAERSYRTAIALFERGRKLPDHRLMRLEPLESRRLLTVYIDFGTAAPRP